MYRSFQIDNYFFIKIIISGVVNIFVTLGITKSFPSSSLKHQIVALF